MRKNLFLALVSVAAVGILSAQNIGTIGGGDSDDFVIPSAANPEDLPKLEECIEEARKNDISVAPATALLYKGLTLISDQEYEDEPDYAQPIPYLEESLRMDPSQQSGWEGLGWCYVKTGQGERAHKLWSYFARLMPEQPLPHSLMAQSYVLRMDWLNAHKEYKKSLELNPNQYDLRFWYAQNLLRIGGSQEAEQILRDLVKENDERIDIQLQLAQLLANNFQDEEAVAIYRNITHEIPDAVPRIYLEQAALEIRVGDLATADMLCADVLEHEPDNATAIAMRADIADIMGHGETAPLEKVVTETRDPIARASARFRLANRCYFIEEKNPGTYTKHQILSIYRDAINDDPSNPEYKVTLGERLLHYNHPNEARRWAETVLKEHNPNHSRALLLLYEVALQQHRWVDCEQALKARFESFDSTNPMYHYYLARIHSSKGEYKEALKEIDLLEAGANEGAVLTLRYSGLTESDWSPVVSVRRLHEHIRSLQRAGWTLISPEDIPREVALKKGAAAPKPEAEIDVPLTARFVDNIRWAITGERRFKEPRKTKKQLPPEPRRYFTITFTGGQKSSLILGTEVAERFGVPFGIFSSTEPLEEYVPTRAGWDELRESAESGNWIVGTELHSADTRRAIDPDGFELVAPLANRLWIDSKNRLESFNEWDRRIRYEFKNSRRELDSLVGSTNIPIAMVSYPFGTLGQDGSCNLGTLRSPVESIVAEAACSYQLGFIPDTSGFTVRGDDLLLVRSWEPDWQAEGIDVVRHACQYHPVFLARHMRAQVAMLLNKPQLANSMVEALRRDGYPEEECRKLETDIQFHFRNRPPVTIRPIVDADTGGNAEHELTRADAQAAARRRELARNTDLMSGSLYEDAVNAQADKPIIRDPDELGDEEDEDPETLKQGASIRNGKDDPWFAPDHPFIRPQVSHSKVNDQIERFQYGAALGLDINRTSSATLEYFNAHLKQGVVPHWNAIVVTNLPYSKSFYRFKMDISEIRGRYNHRTEEGTLMTFSFGRQNRKPKNRRTDWSDVNLQDYLNWGKFTPPKATSGFVFSAGTRFSPRDDLTFTLFYDHDYVNTAVRNVTYDSVGAVVNYIPTDELNITSRTQYWSYRDSNAMYMMHGESYWLIDEDRDVWLGGQAYVVSTSKPTDFYWTPYWDQRLMATLRYRQNNFASAFTIDFMYGLSRSRGRGERAYENDVTVKKERYAKDENGNDVLVEEKHNEKGWYVLNDTSTAWESAWGVQMEWERRLGDNVVINAEANILALREYIDHNFMLSLTWRF